MVAKERLRCTCTAGINCGSGIFLDIYTFTFDTYKFYYGIPLLFYHRYTHVHNFLSVTRRYTEVCFQPWCNPLWLTGLKAPTNCQREHFVAWNPKWKTTLLSEHFSVLCQQEPSVLRPYFTGFTAVFNEGFALNYFFLLSPTLPPPILKCFGWVSECFVWD